MAMLKVIALCALISTAFLLHAGVAQSEPAGAPPTEEAGLRCWSPAALDGRTADKKIIKGTPLAFVPPPMAKPMAATPIPRAERGAIRRVDLPPGLKLVALTFDLCEQPNEIAGYDAELVTYLRKQDVKATFFAGGKWLLTHPAYGQQLMADPLFEVGNHSWGHRNLRILSDRALRNEIAWPQTVYEAQFEDLAARQCTGRTGAPVKKTKLNQRMSLFRFPFGACNGDALDAVAEQGLIPIQWDVSSGDPTRSLSAATMAADVIRRVRPGSIVLFHANGRGWHTAEALKTIIPKLRAEGYRFVSVGDLLRTPGAKVDRQSKCFDDKPGDTDRYDRLAVRLEASYEAFLKQYGVPHPVEAVRAKAQPQQSDAEGVVAPLAGPPQ